MEVTKCSALLKPPLPPHPQPSRKEVIGILSVSGSSEPPGQKDQDWFHNSLGEKNTLDLTQAQLGLQGDEAPSQPRPPQSEQVPGVIYKFESLRACLCHVCVKNVWAKSLETMPGTY